MLLYFKNGLLQAGPRLVYSDEDKNLENFVFIRSKTQTVGNDVYFMTAQIAVG